MNKKIKQFLTLILLTFSFFANAQLYPVQVTPVLTPPYNLKLSSYATTTDVKLRVNILLRDVNEFNRQVRLKLIIKGQGLNIQSQQFVNGASPIYLNGGTNQELTNLDLGAYFQLNNLLGINPIQYNRPLPDGQYNFCFEVYDFFTNQLISNTGCFPVFLIVNDPPFLNIPQRGEQIVLKDPVNIIFQWTPRHLNATNVTYEYEIREIWDNQIDPQAGFLASPPLYSETTRATTFLYNNTKPALLPDKTYAWRVRAISTNGISENSVFRNNGYSEIYNFRTTKNCDAPKYPLSEIISKSTVKINWQGNLEHNKYHVQYRKVSYSKETDKQKEKREKINKKRAKKGQKEKEYTSKKENFEWFEVYTYNEQAQISNLEAGQTYEFRVGGTCTSLTEFKQYYSYTNTNEFTMPTAEETVNYNCGVLPDIQIANQDPIQNIGVNETFIAGDFPVTVKEVQNNGGKFTGKGFIVVPYLADTKIAVAFEGITINTNYQLIEGVVKTTYDPTFSNVESVDEFIDDLIDSLGGLLDDIINSIKDGINADILIDQWQDIIDDPNNGLTTQQELALQNYIDDKDKVKSDLKNLREKIEQEGISDEDIKKYYVSNFAPSNKTESNQKSNINFDKLFKWVKDNKGKTLEFNYEDFIHEPLEQTTEFGIQKIDFNIPLKYEKDGEQIKVILTGYLNTRKENITIDNQNTNISIDFKDGYIEDKIHFNYLQKYINPIEEEDNYAFKASVTKVDNFDNLLHFLNLKLTDDGENFILREFNDEFKKVADNCNKIDYLYEEAPSFVLNNRKEQLWDDLNSLLNCSVSSVGTNEGKAIFNIFNTLSKETDFYKDLTSRSSTIIKLYEKLNGDYLTKVLSTITATCENNWTESELKESLKVYYGATDKNSTKYEFAECKTESFGIPIISCNEENKIYIRNVKNEGGYVGSYEIEKNLAPLSPVLIYHTSGDVVTLPAIYIKHISDNENWQEWKSVFFDYLNGVGLTSAYRGLIKQNVPSLIKFLALVEFSKTVVDVALQDPLLIASIQQNGNDEFIQNWHKISIAIDIATISSDVLISFSKNGKQVSTLMRNQGKTDAANTVDEYVEYIEKNIDEIADVGVKIGKYDLYLVKKYFKHIQEVTGRAVPKNQIEKLKNALRVKEYNKLSPQEYVKHSNKYNDNQRRKMIKDWEENTKQEWPKYKERYYSQKTREVYKEIGDPYDLHHIIEKQYDGPHEWWNSHPAKFPTEHQGGIHSKNSPAKELFK